MTMRVVLGSKYQVETVEEIIVLALFEICG